jgi:prophage antirepressor-like protein
LARPLGFRPPTSANLTTFTAPIGANIRVVEIDGSPWFVAADVCRALTLTNRTEALRPLDADARTLRNFERAASAPTTRG